jgi:hypothetical protein
MKKTINEIVSERGKTKTENFFKTKRGLNIKKNENSLPKVDKNKNPSVIESIYVKNAYINLFKNKIPTFNDENLFKIYEEHGKGVNNIKTPKDIDNLCIIDDVYKKTQSSYRSTNFGTPFLYSNRSNKQSSFNVSNFLSKNVNSPKHTFLKIKLNKSYSDQMTSNSPEKLNKIDSTLKCRKTTSYQSVRSTETRKTQRKVLVTECENIIERSEKVLNENQSLIEKNQSRSQRIYDKHLSDKKYVYNDVDMKMFKKETKQSLKNIDVFLYGNSRGHRLGNQHKIFFFQTDREEKREIFKKN